MEMPSVYLNMEEIQVIKIYNICKNFNEKIILNNINLTFYENQITFIVGTSGAGKTTLLNIIGGLDKPTSGDVIFDNKNIGDNLNDYRAKDIGFVFQDYNLISGLNVLQNIEIATDISGIKINKDDIVSEIGAFGISNPYQKVETLSGGEKQRTAIIRSICKDAAILIADEPTGSLDSHNADLVFEMLQSIKKNKHIIIVSHDMEKARKYADRIITISDGNITNDEIITRANDEKELSANTKPEEIKVIKNKNIFRSIFTLGKNSVRMRIGKIISIALVIALSIASLTTVININRLGSSLSHNVNVNYLENDLMTLYYNIMPNCGYMEYPFSEEDIMSVKKEYDLKDIVNIYIADKHNLFFEAENKTIDACIKQININDFFEERVMSNNIEGSFIAKEDEIIIAEDVAQELFGEDDCIGKKVFLNDGEGYKVEYTIVGINHTKNPSDNILSFISADSLKKLCENKLSENIYNRQVLDSYYTTVQSMIVGGIYGQMKETDSNLNLIYGNLPNSSDEVLISTEILVNVLNEFGISNRYSKEDILSGKISDEDIKKIYSKKFAINYNGVFAVSISGGYVSDDLEMRYTSELIDEMKKIDPISIEIYASNPEQVTRIKEDINEKYNFEAHVQLDTLKQNISNQTMFFSAALILIVIVLICISFALLSSFSKIAVLERKKEIAIIKSLGANNKNVLCILLFDAAVISIIAFVMSIGIYTVIKITLPYFLKNINLLDMTYPLGLMVVVSTIFTILIFLQTSLSLRKIVKQMPAELFKQ